MLWTVFSVMGSPGGIGFTILQLLTLLATLYAAWRGATAQRQTLKSPEDLLREAIEGLPHGFELYDADDRLVMCNEAVIKSQPHLKGVMKPGVKFETAVRASIMNGFIPEAVGRVDEWIAERIARHRNPKGMIEQQFSDGSWHMISESRTFDGGIVYLRTDITERKLAEESLREMQELLIKTQELGRIGSFEWDERKDEGIYRSDVIYDIYGVSLDGWPRTINQILAQIHPDDRERMRAAYVEIRGSGKGYDLEYRIVRPDDEVGYVHEISTPEFNESGEHVRSVGTIQDITKLKLAEEQLRQAQKMQAIGQLTAGVAHDFNNVLAVIIGNVELLEDDLGEGNPQLAEVYRATQRAADLTQRLLAFSRKQVLNPKVVNANALIAGITGLLRRTLEEHIDIEAVTAAGLWNCEVDPAQLENALLNLAINARDAMPDGGRLTIETANAQLDDDYATAQAEVTPGQYVMVAITDTGSGMPPEVCEHVFEPFFTTKAVGAGSGLGLSMVYGFVKQSGGHVTVYSEQGEGTTIKLYLPRSGETAAAERKPATDRAPVARGETVLVVEDDPDLRTLTAALLGKLGYRVIVAATGAAALEQLGTRVNLLLTDVMLPGGMNGRELAEEAQRCASGLQVLYMSGYTENAIVHNGRLDTDAELLQKPFRRADLARAVRRVLDSRSD